MNARAYLLLEITDGSSEHAVKILRSRVGVVLADRLEGNPNIIVMVEAPDRKRLAEVIMQAIGCIDSITEDLHLLVTQTKEILPTYFAPRNSKPMKGIMENINIG